MMATLGVSKLANALFTISLQTRLTASSIPIIVLAVHAGPVNTFSHKLPFTGFFDILLSPLFYKPDQGAATSCIAAAGPEIRRESIKYGGAYMEPIGRLSEYANVARNMALGEELWTLTQEILK